MTTTLLADIEAFLRETGMGEYRFGIRAARNGRLLQRLRAGRAGGKSARVWPETEDEIRNFISQERRKRAPVPEDTSA